METEVVDHSEKEIINEALQNPLSYRRSLVKSSLYEFIEYFWDQYSNDEFHPNWHISYICRVLEKEVKKVANFQPKDNDIVINLPPGSTKTAVVSIFFPLWCWSNWFWMRFICSSYGADLSLENAEYSRDIIRSEKFKELFPELEVKDDKDVKSNFRIVKIEKTTKFGGNRLSTSVTGSVTGFHGHVLIWDDLIDPNRSISKAETTKANNHLDGTLSTRKVDKEITLTIGIMQRLSNNDPTEHLLKNRKELLHICLPGEIKTEKFREKLKPKHLEKYYKDGLLDPKRLSWKVLQSMKEELGQYGYSAQIGQDPVPPGGGMFQVDNIIPIQRPPMDMHVTHTVRYWDKAGSKDQGAYTAGVKMCRLKSGIFIILDVRRGQWGSHEREKIIRQTAEADGQNCFIYVEQEPGSGGKESAEATIRNLAGFSARKDRPVGDKTQRADPYSVQVNEGNVQMMTGDWNKDYLDELEHFPDSEYKDQVDASSGAFAKLTKKKQVKVNQR